MSTGKIKLTFDGNGGVTIRGKNVGPIDKMYGIVALAQHIANMLETDTDEVMELAKAFIDAEKNDDIEAGVKAGYRISDLERKKLNKTGLPDLDEDGIRNLYEAFKNADSVSKEKTQAILEKALEDPKAGKANVSIRKVNLGKPDEPQEPLS